jgi:hypothetical protein
MSDLISRQQAIDAIKALWDDAPTAQHVSAMFDCEDAIQALPPAQPEPDHFREVKKMIWHECDPDDPSSFPDDDRAVLVSFPDSPIPAVGWFERNDDFYGWTDGEQFGLHADGWWELPKKPTLEK